jgi:hypothetical protein
MFGEQYISAGKWVPFGGVIFAILVIINFFITTLLTKDSKSFNIFLLIGLLLVSVGIIIARTIIEVLIIEGIIYTLVAFSLFIVIKKGEQNEIRIKTK